MALADELKDLDRRIAVTFERTLADFRQRLASRLKEEGEATLRALDELAPTLPQRMLADDDLADVAHQASAAGRREAIDHLVRTARRLDRGKDQVEILSALLEAAAGHASRVALVLCSDQGLRGWAAIGFGTVVRNIEQFTADQPPGEAWEGLFAGEGVVPLAGDDCAPLCIALDAPLPSEGILIPFVLDDSVAAALYADRLDDGSLDVATLQLLTHLAALGVEVQGLRQRSCTPTLYQPGELSGAGLGVWKAPVLAETAALSEAGEVAPPEPTGSPPVAVPSDWNEAPTVETLAPPAAATAAVADTVPESPRPVAQQDGEIAAAARSAAATAELEAVPELPELPTEEPAEAETGTAGAESSEEATWESVETTEEPVAAVWQAAADQPTFEEIETAETPDIGPLVFEEVVEEPVVEAPASTRVEPPSEASWEAIEDLPTSEVSLSPADDRSTWAPGTAWQEIPVPPPPPAEEPPGSAPAAAAEMQPAESQASPEPPEQIPEKSEISLDATVAVSQDILQRYAHLRPPEEEAEASASWGTTATPLPTRPEDADTSEDETVLLQRSPLAAPRTRPSDDDTSPTLDGETGSGASPGAPESRGASAQVAAPTDLQGPGWAFTGGHPGTASDDPAFEEARRLARLLVSEIKLYNEEHVEEGRRNHDIYDRLREDIDRSRQIYEERVDPKVREHDFFHEALVRVLAGGDAKALGM